MNVSQALDDIKTFLEGDPLVQAAVNLVVPASTRGVLADALNALAGDIAAQLQAAHDQGRADEAAAAQLQAAQEAP